MLVLGVRPDAGMRCLDTRRDERGVRATMAAQLRDVGPGLADEIQDANQFKLSIINSPNTMWCILDEELGLDGARETTKGGK